ncbi:ELMO domain-containing protein 2 [Eurytemora carolleeae]|uniref:ELMO domain-containing protein 2 n=1 Tax=Eurytemora carolleeae TaxID=1294199 RepID=UPI000C78DE05|nr:ELMO domain-containing protein 2 [Eurytemora carolleeae]|eukprot:XP_023328484.1 ELMO domain-containing protein 2-like [Eurytemora affinis]
MDWITRTVSMLLWYLRPLVKWFLRQTTRLCELQRVCYGEPAGAQRTLAVEQSLKLSRNKQISVILSNLDTQTNLSEQETKKFIEDSVNSIMKTKSIKPDLHRQFVSSMSACFKHMIGYRQIMHRVETLRCEAYDENKLDHEVQLLELWRLLQPNTDLDKRVTKQWQVIGFQGDDPKTDFRGMGMLGLQNLIYFAREYSSAAKHILSHSHHPKFGLFTALPSDTPSTSYSIIYISSVSAILSSIYLLFQLFYHLYIFCFSYLFIEFDKFWLEMEPRDIMEFNRIRDLFESNLRSQLEDSRTCFKLQLYIDTV